MNTLVINCGSSSIKLDVIQTQTQKRLIGLEIQRIREAQPELHWDGDVSDVRHCPASGHDAALRFALPLVEQLLGDQKIEAVGHRIAHGGDQYDQPAIIDDSVLQAVEYWGQLATLHNPLHLMGVRIAQELYADIPHVAVFDTSFHQTLPKRAYTYALPKALRDKWHLRRYGFHGTSHQYVAQKAADFLGTELKNLRIISCHLGSGASVAAIEYGRSVETSMGMTPLEGLVMGTRPGDVDPGILLHIAQHERWTTEQLDRMLNKDSGLCGLAGVSDMRDILDRAANGDEDSRLAIQVFAHRLRKYIGAYAAVMGGVDVILFTAGIGEHSPVVRSRVCQRLDFLGAVLDEDRNLDVRLSDDAPVADFSSSASRVKLLAVRTDEQRAIAQQTAYILGRALPTHELPNIPIAVSARHVHLTQDMVETLFGAGYQLTEKAPLSQPGQFAANELVTLVGPKNHIERVRILGPCRNLNQVEISRTDEFFLGLDAPIRASGKTENSPGIKLVGPAGEATLPSGVICAWRHIHMHTNDAALFGVQDGDIVEVEVNSGTRPLTFGNVLVRVSPSFKLEMHIDTDEANAAELPPLSEGELVKTEHSVSLVKRK